MQEYIENCTLELQFYVLTVIIEAFDTNSVLLFAIAVCLNNAW